MNTHWDATTVTRHSGHDELWIDADWLLGRPITSRSSQRRSRGLLAFAVILFCIGPAFQAAKKPTRREDGKAALQRLSAATSVEPSRRADGGGIPGKRTASASASTIASIADTDFPPNTTLAANPTDNERSVTLDFSLQRTQQVVAPPSDANHISGDQPWDDLLLMGPTEPTWSPTAFWYTTCRTSWGESPWDLRPDAWVVPAVSVSEVMQ
jgi:hypothetical protein